MPFSFLLIIMLTFSVTSAVAAPKTDPYLNFTQACFKGFDPSSELMGHHICECAAEESKHQGVAVTALKKETKRIEADPKYKIQDKRLLASFQYCTIETMKSLAAAAGAPGE